MKHLTPIRLRLTWLRLTRLELKSFSADIKFLIILPMLPLLIILSLGPLLRFAGEESASSAGFSILIADQSDSGTVQMAVSAIMGSRSLSGDIEIIQGSEEEAYSMAKTDRIAAAVIIPADFISSVQAGNPSAIKILLNSRQPMQASLMTEGIKNAARMMGDVQNALYMISSYTRNVDGISSDQVFGQSMMSLILSTLARDSLYVTETVSAFPDSSPIFHYGTAALIIFLCFSSFLQLVKHSPSERLGIRRRLRLSGTAALLCPAAEGTAMGILLFLQGLIPCLCLLYVSGVFSSPSPGQNLLILPALLLVCIGIGFCACLWDCFKKPWSYLFMGGFYLISILLSGILIPPSFSGGLGILRHFMLPKHWSNILTAAAYSAAPGNSLLLSYGIALLFPAVCLLVNGGLLHGRKELS